MDKLHLLLLLVTLLSVSLSADAGFDFLKFGSKNKDKEKEKAQPDQRVAEGGRDREFSREHSLARSDSLTPSKLRGGLKRHLDLSAIRAAKEDYERLVAPLDLSKAPSSGGGGRGATKKVQGRGRRDQHVSSKDAAESENLDEPDDEQDEEDDEAQWPQAPGQDARAPKGLVPPSNNKKLREDLLEKLIKTQDAQVSTGEQTDAVAQLELAPKLSYQKRRPKSVFASADAKKNLISGKFWSKHLGKAYQGAKKGLIAGANALSEVPKKVVEASESINAFLQLDSGGRLLALIEEANQASLFVRREFSQFTTWWSPLMEDALNYVGDENLDTIKWIETDPLDLRKDALHSLVIGYEFVRMMIIWRENLLVAHEAYKLHLKSVKRDYDQQKFDVNEDMVMELRTIHNYMLHLSWDTITDMFREPRAKLDHLMELEDDRTKNYESMYFRNIIILQRMYLATVEEFDAEREQLGDVVEDLEDVEQFFENFRDMVAGDEFVGLDIRVPAEMTNFLAMLQPQLRFTPLVYTKGFLNTLNEDLARPLDA